MSASAGRVLIKPRGVYNPATPYEILDSVFYNGSSYICINDTLGHAPTDSGYWQIFAQGAGVISGAFAGACDSLGSAQVKSVIIPPADNFVLQKGVIVGVRFTNTNTFEATSENSIALNVNNTGALPIYFDGTATPLGDNVVAFGEAAYTHFYQYDGSNWVFIGRSGVQTAEQTPYDSTKSTKAVIDELADKLVTTSETVTGNPLSFTTDSAQPSQNTVITFEPIQAGSGDPSPSNVRAISGYDEIDLAVPRKNWFTGTYTQAYLSAYASGKKQFVIGNGSNGRTAIVKVGGGLTYTVSKTPNSGNRFMICASAVYPSNLDIVDLVYNGAETDYTGTLTIDAKYKYILVYVDTTTAEPQLQVELGSTATAYEPYDPITDISEPFPSTIYGGTLDVESGELVVDRAKNTLITSGVTWYLYDSDNKLFRALSSPLLPNAKKPQTNNIAPNAVSDKLVVTSYASIRSSSKSAFSIDSDGIKYVKVVDSAVTDLASFTTWLNTNNIQVAYELATPITYHLNPNQVRLLQGANVVTSNGTSLSLTYRNGEVATLEDLDGLAESINGASKSIKHLNDTETIISGSNILLMRTGNVVSLILNGASTGGGGNGLVLINGANFSIPSKYRPKADTYAGATSRDSSNVFHSSHLAIMSSNGQVIIAYPNGGSITRVDNGFVYGSASWII